MNETKSRNQSKKGESNASRDKAKAASEDQGYRASQIHASAAPEAVRIYGSSSIKARYDSARSKLQRRGDKFAGVRVIDIAMDDETLPAGSREIKNLIGRLEPEFDQWNVFTNYNYEIVFQSVRLTQQEALASHNAIFAEGRAS